MKLTILILSLILIGQSGFAGPVLDRSVKEAKQLLYVHMGPCTVEGPLTIKEVEKREMKNIRKSPSAPQVPFGFQNQEWKQFKRKYAKGDEIYFFSSSEERWNELAGRAGYALIRNGDVVDVLITLMN